MFHALRDLAKVVGVSFHLKLARLEEKRTQAQCTLSGLQAKGKNTYVQERLMGRLDEQIATLRANQTGVQQRLREASYAVHPFALSDSSRQQSAQVEATLQQVLDELNTLRARHTAGDNTAAVAKFARQIPDLAALIDTWWLWVEQSLAPERVDGERRD